VIKEAALIEIVRKSFKGNGQSLTNGALFQGKLLGKRFGFNNNDLYISLNEAKELRNVCCIKMFFVFKNVNLYLIAFKRFPIFLMIFFFLINNEKSLGDLPNIKFHIAITF